MIMLGVKSRIHHVCVTNITIANVGFRVAINVLEWSYFIVLLLGFMDFQGPMSNDHDHRFLKAHWSLGNLAFNYTRSLD